METKFAFTKRTIDEFETWIASFKVARTILYLQQHHTWSPHYGLFTGNNHFELQKSMQLHHVQNNGWQDIGQHFTIFPDGAILTGRPLEKTPACIYGNNANAICIENLGNFDLGADIMTDAQSDSIIRASAAICLKYSIPVNTDKIVYHHWFNLDTGDRNNGTGSNKSCPGSNFFGGNKVADSRLYFIPMVEALIDGEILVDTTGIIKYVCVTANKLNIRKKPDAESELVPDRHPVMLGSVLRVYKIQNGWFRISSSKMHWVSGRNTQDVTRKLVTADILNVRNGPAASFQRIGSFKKDQEVFVFAEENGWCKIRM